MLTTKKKTNISHYWHFGNDIRLLQYPFLRLTQRFHILLLHKGSVLLLLFSSQLFFFMTVLTHSQQHSQTSNITAHTHLTRCRVWMISHAPPNCMQRPVTGKPLDLETVSEQAPVYLFILHSFLRVWHLPLSNRVPTIINTTSSVSFIEPILSENKNKYIFEIQQI